MDVLRQPERRRPPAADAEPPPLFYTREKQQVDAFHRAGVEAGFRSNGGPGYYAAYLLDPDDNNVEALYRDAGNVGHGADPRIR